MKRSAGTEDARSTDVSRRRFLLAASATGVCPALLGVTSGSSVVSQAEWTFETEDAFNSSPTVVDGTLYVGSDDTDVYAVDVETGTEQWTFTEPSGRVHSSPTVVDGTVFVGSADETVYALDAETGDERWAFTDPSDSVESSPTVADGYVYVGSYDHTVYAIDAATGDSAWEFETGDPVHSSPTVVNDTVYIGSDDGSLYALDAETGESEWEYPTDGAVNSSPTVADGLVYVGSEDGHLYALDATDGSLEWEFETDPYLGIRWSSPTVADGRVYVGSTDASLYALDATSGSEEWAFRTGAAVRSSPTVGSSTVFAGSVDGALYALDTETGDEDWRFETDSDILASPTVAEGMVFFGDEDGTLYAIDVDAWASDGSRVALGTLGHHGDWADQKLPEPPTFEISALDHPTEVAEGESISVDVTVANVGDRDGEVDLSLTLSGGTLHEESIAVPANEEEVVTADVSITADPGDHELRASVAWDGQTEATTGELVVAGEPARFEVSDLAVGEAVAGDTLDVEVTVTNVGAEAGTADLTFELAGVSETTTVDLAGGESETVSTTLSLEDSEGEYDLLVQVGSDDDSDELQQAVVLDDPDGGPLAGQGTLVLGGGGVLAMLGLGAYGLHRRRGRDETPDESPEPPAAEDAAAEHVAQNTTAEERGAESVGTAATDSGTDDESGAEEIPRPDSAQQETGKTTAEASSSDEPEDGDDMETTIEKDQLDDMETTIEKDQLDDMETTIEKDQLDDMETTIEKDDLDEMETTIEKDDLDEMETTIENDQLDEMKTTIEKSEIDDLETTIEKSEIDDLETTIEKSELDDLETRVGNAQPTELTEGERQERLAKIEAHLDEAEQARDDHRFDDAIERCETAIEVANDLFEAIEGEDIGTVALVESHRDRATQLQEDIQVQKEGHRRVLRKLEGAAETLDDLEARVEKGNTHAIVEELDALEETITDIEALHRRHGVPDAPQNTGRLRRRCTALRDRAEEALTDGPPSGEIPQPPSVSMAYDDLTRRELLGSGGNADVYRATAETDDGTLTVALKEPRVAPAIHADTVENPPDEPARGSQRDDSSTGETQPARAGEGVHDSETRYAGHLERMLNEAETWQRLDDHDHIVDVIDYGDTPTPWIAMEYMDGGHLRDRAGEMAFDQALWTAIAITKAVRHAHRRGVAHLDLKSENILFQSMDNAWDVPKVADWGLSKHLLQYSKSIEGLSPHYAAPEQFDDSLGPGDDLTDIYQLGTVFYELFTGRPPFRGNPAQVMHKVLHEDVIPPSELVDVPDELDDILLKAMAKRKDDRYEAVLVLRNDLQELQSSYTGRPNE